MELKKYKLEDLGKIVTGKTPSTFDEENYGNDYMFISPTELHNGYKIFSSQKMISQKGFNSIKSNTIDGPSVLVGCIGWDMGNVGYTEKKCATNQQINSITDFSDFCEPLYLYYWLRNKKEYLFSIASVTRTPILSKSTFSEIPISLPNIEQQKKIVNILSTIDDKIALNRRINAKLEAMAKRLYDYWFVQFDFPTEDGKPYKSSGGKMVYNETLKRDIPAGWEVGKIGDLFESQAGFAFKSSEWTDSGYPVLTIKNIQGDGSITFTDLSFIKDFNDKLRKYAANNGNMIFAMSGNTIGKIGIIATTVKEVLINQRVLILKTTPTTIAFPYFIVSNSNVQNLVFQLGANSAQPNISEEEFRNIKICIPSEHILNLFNENLRYSFDTIISNRIQIQKLTAMRDRLLPLLMNGQVEVNIE